MLYLLKSGNYLKIGYAKNIEERMKLYTTHNPDFELLDKKEGTLLDEKELHRICKKWKYDTCIRMVTTDSKLLYAEVPVVAQWKRI